jgi:hypothetical protein
MSFEVAGEALPKREDVKPGEALSFAGQTWRVDDIKQATCTYSQGELPFAAPLGRACVSVDLDAGDQGFATLDYGPEGAALYVGQGVDFDALALSGLRSIDGW